MFDLCEGIGEKIDMLGRFEEIYSSQELEDTTNTPQLNSQSNHHLFPPEHQLNKRGPVEAYPQMQQNVSFVVEVRK
jgi:hypothetical protein